jgi:UDP-N-acetylglucosamine 2-epimerase (non-hydrolysing)
MKRMLIVFGTRPEVLKLDPLIQALSAQFAVILFNTQQHAASFLKLPSHWQHYSIFSAALHNVSLPLTSRVGHYLAQLDTYFMHHAPVDYVLVQGDTASAYAGALAAFHRHIPVIHIEAGLRTHDLSCPFPEEFYRQCISKLAAIHFAPNQTAKNNLASEGIQKNVYVVGNTIEDKLHSVLLTHCAGLRPKKQILITFHRRENIQYNQDSIQNLIKKSAQKYSDTQFIWVTHPSFRLAMANGIPNLQILPPLDYEAFIQLMYQSSAIITDSGGIQEEAAILNIPAIVVREKTERVEELKNGNVLYNIAKATPDAGFFDILNAIQNRRKQPEKTVSANVVSEKICKILEREAK